MSTLAEHVAAIEFYKANYDEREGIRQALDMELWLLASGHLKELAAMCRPAGLQEAREAFAARLRLNHGDAAGPFIVRWKTAIAAAPSTPEKAGGVSDGVGGNDGR